MGRLRNEDVTTIIWVPPTVLRLEKSNLYPHQLSMMLDNLCRIGNFKWWHFIRVWKDKVIEGERVVEAAILRNIPLISVRLINESLATHYGKNRRVP